MVSKLVVVAPRRVYELGGYGALFFRVIGGLIAQRKFGAHSFQRTCYAADRTGHEMEPYFRS